MHVRLGSPQLAVGLLLFFLFGNGSLLAQEKRANRLTGGDKAGGITRTFQLLRPNRAIVIRFTQLSKTDRDNDDDRIIVELKTYRLDRSGTTPVYTPEFEFSKSGDKELRGNAAVDSRFVKEGSPRQRFISFMASKYVDGSGEKGMVQVWGSLDTGSRQGLPGQTAEQADKRRLDDELHVRIRLPRTSGSDNPCEDFPDDDILGGGGDYDEVPDYPEDYEGGPDDTDVPVDE